MTIAVLIGAIFSIIAPALYILFVETFIIEKIASVYGGWFDWLSFAEWIFRLFVGFIAGLCMALLAIGRRRDLWALFVGLIIMLAAYATTSNHWPTVPSILQRVSSNLWPIMYPLGAWLGGLATAQVKHRAQV